MNKNTFAKLLVLAVVITLVINVFFGRFIAAKISTLPLLNRLHIISPQAPIVINTTRQERISDTGDTLNAVNAIKSKISLVMAVKDGQSQVLGGAVNLASEGLFLTSKTVVGINALNTLYIKLDNGSVAQVTDVSADSATNLLVLRAKLTGIPVATFGNSESLSVGQKLIFVSPSLLNFNPHFSESFVASSQKDQYAQTLNSDTPARTFGVQDPENLSAGSVIANTDGEVVGVWDGKAVISSDIINSALSLFFSKQSFVRPLSGFSYKPVSPAESQVLHIPSGAIIKSVITASPAAKAGLLEGDIIQIVGGNSITEDNSLEELLSNYKPGDNVSLKISRADKTLDVTLTLGQLK